MTEQQSEERCVVCDLREALDAGRKKDLCALVEALPDDPPIVCDKCHDLVYQIVYPTLYPQRDPK